MCIMKTCVSVIIRARLVNASTVPQLYESLCALRYLALAYSHLAWAVCAGLLICSDVSLRKLRARTLSPGRLSPSLPLSLPRGSCSDLSPRNPSPHLVFWRLRELRRWHGEIRETSLSKVVHPQHFAAHRSLHDST